ncbi:MAG TPA: hypothetical protein VML53_01070 [Thermoplasmata archaeon]|nr:hypothetical protein [Thermoplasmata archaeon]
MVPTGDSLNPFERPTSVFLGGSPRPLVNWVAFAVVRWARADYFWTDVRQANQPPDLLDPVTLGRIPAPQLHVVPPDELRRNEPPSDAALARLTHRDEPSDSRRRLGDFLRLSTHTQEVIARHRPEDRPFLLILSNAQRIASLYPADVVRPVVEAIVGSGFSLLLTFADTPPEGRREFDVVLSVIGGEPPAWRDATLSAERGGLAGVLNAGESARLHEIPSLARILEREIPHA